MVVEELEYFVFPCHNRLVYGSKLVKNRLKSQKFEPYFTDYRPDLSLISHQDIDFMIPA